MNIQVNREQFEDIKNCLNNSIISTEEWDPEKGMLLIKCEDDLIVTEVKECENVGQGRWLIIFVPILPGVVMGDFDKPVSSAVSEIPEKPKRPPRPMKAFLESMTKPWHGYIEK